MEDTKTPVDGWADHPQIILTSGRGTSTRLGPQGTPLTQINCIVLTPTLLRVTSRSVRRPPYIDIMEHILNKG